ncbi:CTAG/Pcc1 family [Lyophyllum atratum]|nr:CTAG/Pcc1 family [Lyophyllum atratum]
MATPSDWHNITLEIPFASSKHATYAKQAIEVDAELQPQAVKRTLDVKDNLLIATFSTLTIRLARLTTNAYLENVDLVVRTLEAFGADADRRPS